MRKHPNHHTSTDESPMEAMRRRGKSEMRFKFDGQWRKIKGGRLFTGATRTAAREAAKEA